MKYASKLIPTPPSAPSAPSAPGTPSAPSAPSAPDASNMPAGLGDSSASGGMPGIPGGGSAGIPGGGNTGEIPAGISGSISAIVGKIGAGIPGGSRGFTADQIRAAMASINLDDYKDDNGVVRCPVSKADREKMTSDLKKIADNH